MIKIGIVTITYNSGKVIDDYLNSLNKQVDVGSTDKYIAVCRICYLK